MDRIDKILSHNGFGSRKDVKRLLKSGCVFVNGKRIFDSGEQVDADSDVIKVGENVVQVQKNLYIMMNKPSGVVSAKTDANNRTVFDVLEESDGFVSWSTTNAQPSAMTKDLHIVGRLDKDSEGLLLFTTNGSLTHKIISPKNECEKKYFVRLKNSESPERQTEIARRFFDGVYVEREGKEADFNAKSAKIEWKNENEAEVIVSEGKFHQVKRMFLALGNEVVYLKRIAIAGLVLDEKLKVGEARELSDAEVKKLQDCFVL